MNRVAEDQLVALVAGEVEEGSTLRCHGHVSTGRVVKLHAIVAFRHVLSLLPRDGTTVLHTRCRIGVVRQRIDEVLDLVAVVEGELLAIRHGAEVELLAVDDVIAILDALVEFLVLGRSSVVLIHRGSSVDRPVDVELHKQRLSHPLRRLTIGVGTHLIGQQRNDVLQLRLDELSHLGTWGALKNLIFCDDVVHDRCVAPTVHHHELKESTHGAGTGDVLLVSPAFSEITDNGVGLRATTHQFAHPVDGSIILGVSVKTWVSISTIVVPAATIADSRVLVGRQFLGLHIAAAETAAQLIIDISHLGFHSNVVVGIFSVERVYVHIQVSAACQQEQSSRQRHKKLIFHCV